MIALADRWMEWVDKYRDEDRMNRSFLLFVLRLSASVAVLYAPLAILCFIRTGHLPS